MARIIPQNFPVGIRFTPSDQELLQDYLKNKNHGLPQPIDLIHEYNIYTCRPDRLPRYFCYGKGNELYFFVTRDLTKSRTTRTVENGYGFWRSTGNNVPVLRDQDGIIGNKRTFNFFKRKPKLEKTNWVMKEYSLAFESSGKDPTSYEGAEMKKVGFVLCKIYENKKASDENQGEEEQMTEMSIRDGPNNSDSDAGTENFESLPFDENQMTEMPLGDGPNNPDLLPFGCHASMGDLLPASEENQITEMPLGVGPNNPNMCDANIEDWLLAFDENQMTDIPLGDNLNNPDFPPFGCYYASMGIPALEENRMTEMPSGHGPDNPDFLPFGCHANTEDSLLAFARMTEMPQGDYPNNADFPSLGCDINMEDWLSTSSCDTSMEDLFLALEKNQMTGMPLVNGPNNPEPLGVGFASKPIAFEENQMTEMPLRDAPNSSHG